MNIQGKVVARHTVLHTLLLTWLILTTWMVSSVHAQQDIDGIDSLPIPLESDDSGGRDAVPNLESLFSRLMEGNEQVPMPTNMDCAGYTDARVKEACWRYLQAAYAYHAQATLHRQRVFAWQHTSTIIIFFTVLVLVATGLFFSWLQFRHSLGEPTEAEESKPAHTELELSTSGIKVSSSVLGVIILSLSIGFFYLYLVHVYPIREVMTSATNVTKNTAQQESTSNQSIGSDSIKQLESDPN